MIDQALARQEDLKRAMITKKIAERQFREDR
jgi:hypothetical protein